MFDQILVATLAFSLATTSAFAGTWVNVNVGGPKAIGVGGSANNWNYNGGNTAIAKGTGYGGNSTSKATGGQGGMGYGGQGGNGYYSPSYPNTNNYYGGNGYYSPSPVPCYNCKG